MRKIIKPEIRCGECSNLKKSAVEDVFCDTCEIKISDKMDNYRGYPFGFNSVGCSGRDQMEFCSTKCGIEWLINKGAKYLKKYRSEIDRGFFSMYLFADDLNYLAKVIKK